MILESEIAAHLKALHDKHGGWMEVELDERYIGVVNRMLGDAPWCEINMKQKGEAKDIFIKLCLYAEVDGYKDD